MAKSPLWRRETRTQSAGERRVVGLSELQSAYNIVDVDPGGAILVTERQENQLAEPSTREIGSAGNTVYGSAATQEYNAQLRGLVGWRKYDEMRRSDAQIRGSLRLIKTPVLSARWFVDPASDSKQDKKIAKFVEDCLFRYMSVSWQQLLVEIMSHLDFGWYAFEKVFDVRDGKVVWQKWAPRHPLTCSHWEYDKNGGPKGLVQYTDKPPYQVFLPIDKLIVFTHDRESGNMEGVSILRPAYKHWFYKDNLYKIDAIQKERHGIGVPLIKLPPGFTASDRLLAEEMGRNLRTNEKAHVVLPPLWEIMTLKVEGQSVDAMASAEHHGRMIYENILAGFMVGEGAGGSVNEHAELFAKATRFIADGVRDTINKWAIPELVTYNWKNVDTFPELRVRRIGDTVDWRILSFAVRNLIGAGVIRPDDALETWFRDEMDMPRAEVASIRQAATPQNPGSAPVPGPPRQSLAKNMDQTKNAGKSNTGTDTSGG